MSSHIKEKIDTLPSNELVEYLKKENINVRNEFVRVTEDGDVYMSLLHYCMQKKHSIRAIEFIISQGGELESPLISNKSLMSKIDVKYILPILKKFNYNPNFDEMTVTKMLIEFLICGDISRVIHMHKAKYFSNEQIFDALKCGDLLVASMDYLYTKISKLCIQHKLQNNNDNVDVLYDKISSIEKDQIKFFKFIIVNGIDLKSITNIELVTQMILDSYLYHIVDYITSVIDYGTLSNVQFYHYSNFPLMNKVLLYPLYNDKNFKNIEQLLMDKTVVRKIIKKRAGPTVTKSGNMLNETPEVEYID